MRLVRDWPVAEQPNPVTNGSGSKSNHLSVASTGGEKSRLGDNRQTERSKREAKATKVGCGNIRVRLGGQQRERAVLESGVLGVIQPPESGQGPA